jgi:uncharacterized protein
VKRSGQIGVLYSAAFAPWLDQSGAFVECLELQAYRFYYPSAKLIDSICRLCPTIISKGRLSLGTPGSLDADHVHAFAAIVEGTNPLWISEPLGFSRTDEFSWEADLPVCPGQRSVCTVADHAMQVMDICQKLLLLEPTASSIQVRGSIRETDFLNQVCQKANCGILLDVTALLVNAINHRFEPIEWLHQVDPRLILQLHVSGYSRRDKRCFDEHLSTVQEDVWNLVEEVLGYCSPRAIILEREGGYPPIVSIERELARLKKLSRTFPLRSTDEAILRY